MGDGIYGKGCIFLRVIRQELGKELGQEFLVLKPDRLDLFGTNRLIICENQNLTSQTVSDEVKAFLNPKKK